MQSSVHPSPVINVVSHVFEVFKDNDGVIELLYPLHNVS